METKSGNYDHLNTKNQIKKSLGAIVGPVWDTSDDSKLSLRFKIITMTLNAYLLLSSHLFVQSLDSPEAVIGACALISMFIGMLFYPRGVLWGCAVMIRECIHNEEVRKIEHKHIPLSMCLLGLGLMLLYFWLVLPVPFDLSSMFSMLTNA